MPRRVEKDPEGRPRLVLVLSCPEFEHSRLAGLKVINHDVKMHLLRHVLTGPVRRRVVIDPLERDALTVVRANVRPIGGGVDGPVEQRSVELRECPWIGTIDNNARETSDSHGGKRRTISGRSASG